MVRKHITSLLSVALAATILLPQAAWAAHPIRFAVPPAQLRASVVTNSAHAALRHKPVPRTWMQAKSSSASQAPTMPPGYYGLHMLHLQYGAAWPGIKFGTWRLWDAGVTWRDLQPKAGVYNWQTLDTFVALAQQQGVDLILELGQTPQWASARPNEAGPYGTGASAEPTSNTLWTNYVSAVATRYKGKIAYYEVWNEADSAGAPTAKSYFSGTPATLVQLTALAAKAIKAADPNAKVIGPSMSGTGLSPMAYLKTLFDLGIGNSIDIIAVHFYVLGQTPEAILPAVQKVQALMHQYNLDAKPIFNTEFGWAAPTTFNNYDDQAGYLMRSMLVGWGAGLSRFMWYAWDNNGWVTLIMTLPDYKTPTPAAKAYVTLENWTQGKEVSRCAAGTPSTTWSCDITDLAGDHSRIYWSTSGNAQVTPSLTWKPAHAVDMYGNVTNYTGGSLTISAHPLLIKE